MSLFAIFDCQCQDTLPNHYFRNKGTFKVVVNNTGAQEIFQIKQKVIFKKIQLKFIYSEKATNSCEISTVDLSYVVCNGQIYGGDFAKFFGLFRIYELYKLQIKKQLQNNYNYLFPWWQQGVLDIQFNKIIIRFCPGKFFSLLLNL